MIGKGVYTLSEAVQYANVPRGTARSWFMPRSDGQGRGPIFRSEYGRHDDDYAISFLNLIEAYVARFFRKEGVKPKILRSTHELLQTELKTPHPFAYADLATNGHRIVRIIQQRGEQTVVDVITRQHFFPQMNLGRIRYGELTRLAEEWAIAEGVIINPTINYGKPVIENSGVSTLIVANQYIANHKNASLVAKLFRLTETGVINAYNFEHGLGRIAA